MRLFPRPTAFAHFAGCYAALLVIIPIGAQCAIAAPAQDTATFEAVRAADLQLAAIGWRLAVPNAPLCDRLEPGLGFQLHTLDQFDSASRAAAQAHFGFAGPVAIEGVIPDGPAARAGLRADDSLVRIGPVDIATLPGKPGTTQRLVATQLAIAILPPDQPVEIEAIRAGKSIRVSVTPAPACRSRFELLLGESYNARADGTMVQISSKFLETYAAEQVAAAVAHEFSHNILRHRDRLEARGVDFGMLAGFGGNVKYFRQTETQADLLSVYLLANAGYPPQASVAFWKAFGPSKAGGVFRSRSHPHWRDRIATIEAEIAKLQATSMRPAIPAVIVERDKPLDGDWQSILVKHR